MNRQYIGARYVPKLFDNNGSNEWVSGVGYEALTIVTYLNNSYTSKKTVPSNIGNPASNPQYWVNTGNYSGAISQLEAEVEELANTVNRMSSVDLRNMSNRKFVFVGDSYTQVPTPDGSFVGVVVQSLGLDASQYHNIGVSGVDMSGFITQVNGYGYADANDITDVVVTGGINDAHYSFAESTLETTIPQLISAIRTKFPNAIIWAGFSGGGYYTNLSGSYSGFNYDNVQNIKFLWENTFSASPYVIYMDKLDEWFRDLADTDFVVSGGSGLHPNNWGIKVLGQKVANFLKGGATFSPDLTAGSRHSLTCVLDYSLWTEEGVVYYDRYDSTERIKINGAGMNLTTAISFTTTKKKIFTQNTGDGNGVAVMKPTKINNVIFYTVTGDNTLVPLLAEFEFDGVDVYLYTPTAINEIENVNSLWYPTLEWMLPANAV